MSSDQAGSPDPGKFRAKLGTPRAHHALALALGLLAFLWPALVNGNAFFLADTTAYMRGPDSVMNYITERSTEWTMVEPRPSSPSTTAPSSLPTKSALSGPARADRVVLAGRSIYYGSLLYDIVSVGGFFSMAILQAMLCVLVAALTVQRMGLVTGVLIGPIGLGAILVALGLLTPVGFFAAYMVPDVFAGLGAVAVAILVAFRAQLSVGEKLGWWMLLVAALCFHSANLLILGGTIGLVSLVALVRGQLRTFPFLLLVAALLIGLLSESLFSLGVKATTGFAPVRPPFLAARLIDDGAGRDYLRERCGGLDLLLCQWRDRLPTASDGILWGGGPGVASFASATPDQKRRLAREELHFIAAVVADRPIAVAQGSMRSIGRQLGKWALPEFNYSPADRAWFETKVPPRALAMLKGTRAWREAMPVTGTVWASGATFALSLLGLLILPFTRIPVAARRFAWILATAIALDVIVAGAMSTPHDRYLMRIIWILPLAMLALLPALLSATRAGRRDGAGSGEASPDRPAASIVD